MPPRSAIGKHGWPNKAFRLYASEFDQATVFAEGAKRDPDRTFMPAARRRQLGAIFRYATLELFRTHRTDFARRRAGLPLLSAAIGSEPNGFLQRRAHKEYKSLQAARLRRELDQAVASRARTGATPGFPWRRMPRWKPPHYRDRVDFDEELAYRRRFIAPFPGKWVPRYRKKF